MKRSKTGWLIGALALSSAGALAVAQDAKKPDAAGGHAGHIVVTPDDVQWTAGPGSIPAGAKMALIEGDPTKPGLFAMRVKLPADYTIPPHWHPADEHVTVISGTMHMGMGDRLDTGAARALPEGSFSVMPAYRSGPRSFCRPTRTIWKHVPSRKIARPSASSGAPQR